MARQRRLVRIEAFPGTPPHTAYVSFVYKHTCAEGHKTWSSLARYYLLGDPNEGPLHRRRFERLCIRAHQMSDRAPEKYFVGPHLGGLPGWTLQRRPTCPS